MQRELALFLVDINLDKEHMHEGRAETRKAGREAWGRSSARGRQRRWDSAVDAKTEMGECEWGGQSVWEERGDTTKARTVSEVKKGSK